jgi:hypothetical protein
VMEKSAARDACLPSFPTMPRPRGKNETNDQHRIRFIGEETREEAAHRRLQLESC